MSTILRKRLRNHWTGMPNATIRDRALSFRATGLLAYLLSMDDGWCMDARVIAEKKGQEGRDAVLTAGRELREAGYMRQVKKRVDGRFVTEVEVSDEPVDEWREHPVLDLTKVGIPGPGEPDPGEPGPDEPASGEPNRQGKTSPKDPKKDPQKTFGRSAAERRDRAEAIVRPWWDERKEAGLPVAQKFVAVRSVVQQVLAQGISEDDVAWALRNAPVVSSGAIQMALNQRRASTASGDALRDAHERARQRDVLRGGSR